MISKSAVEQKIALVCGASVELSEDGLTMLRYMPLRDGVELCPSAYGIEHIGLLRNNSCEGIRCKSTILLDDGVVGIRGSLLRAQPGTVADARRLSDSSWCYCTQGFLADGLACEVLDLDERHDMETAMLIGLGRLGRNSSWRASLEQDREFVRRYGDWLCSYKKPVFPVGAGSVVSAEYLRMLALNVGMQERTLMNAYRACMRGTDGLPGFAAMLAYAGAFGRDAGIMERWERLKSEIYKQLVIG